MMNKLKIGFLTCLILPIIFSVSSESSTYLVLSVERVRKNAIEKSETFYWVAKLEGQNSLNVSDFKPLVIDNITDINYETCCQGEISYTSTSFEKSTYVLSDEALSSISSLKKHITNSRIEYQKTTKKWSNGNKEKLFFYVTPLIGSFCYCKVYEDEFSVRNADSVFMPTEKYELDESLFDKEILFNLLPQDLTMIPTEY